MFRDLTRSARARRGGWVGALVLAFATLAGVATTARGEVRAFRGTVVTTVQERLGGEASSLNEQSDDFPLTPSPRLIDAASELSRLDLTGALIARGRGFALLDDPTVSTDPNPAEYALEVACFSNAPRLAYTVTTRASEVRQLAFTPTDRGASAFFPAAPGQQVESTVFVGATFLFWSTRGARSLDDTRATLNVAVRDSRRVVLLSPTVFSSELTFEGTRRGSVVGRASGPDPIRFEIMDLEALRRTASAGSPSPDTPLDVPPDVPLDAPGLSPVDERVTAAQALVDQADTLGLRTLVAVFVPAQALPYTYELQINVPFELTADFELSVRNAPGGTGVAAVMGRPFDALAAILNQSVTGIDGLTVQQSVNRLARAVERDGASETRAPVAPGAALCGSIGPLSVAMLAFGLTLCRPRRRLVDRVTSAT